MNVLGALQLGFIYALLALGVAVTFRVLNTPDLTVDGSFTLGMAASAMLTVAGHPALGLLAAFVCGGLAGAVTGLLQTKAGIHPILAGILTMTGLYSVNLFLMGGSPNVSLLGKGTLFSGARALLPAVPKDVVHLVLLMLFCIACTLILAWFFHTGLGLWIRATGNNQAMVRASSIDGELMCILAVSIANAFAALSGAVLAQYQGYADINAGSGVIVVGLASVIIGEVLLRQRTLTGSLAAFCLGAVIYRLLIALALYLNFFPAYMLKAVSALIVGAALSLPALKAIGRRRRRREDTDHYAAYRQGS